MRTEDALEIASAGERPSALAARHIALRVDPSCMRRVHHDIVARLAAKGTRVSLAFGKATHHLPTSVDLLLDLERIIYRLRGLRLSDRCAWDETTPRDASSDSRPDLVFDLSEGEPVRAGEDRSPHAPARRILQ